MTGTRQRLKKMLHLRFGFSLLFGALTKAPTEYKWHVVIELDAICASQIENGSSGIRTVETYLLRKLLSLLDVLAKLSLLDVLLQLRLARTSLVAVTCDFDTCTLSFDLNDDLHDDLIMSLTLQPLLASRL